MTISISQYVSITSGVGGASPIPAKQLILRLLTTNPLVPAGTSIDFSGGPQAALASVAAYFGTASAEYARAAFYFAWTSPRLGQAQAISFWGWAATARAPQIFGDDSLISLTALQGVTAGTFVLNLNGQAQTIGPLNLSTANSLAAVAIAVQGAINGVSGTLWSNATVQFNSTTGNFIFTGGVAGACTVAVTDGTQNLAAALGWTSIFPNTILAPGAAAVDVPTTLNAMANFSNNFGSFAFIPTITQTQMGQASLWAKASNVQYRYCQAVNAANAALFNNGGTDLILSPIATEFPELCPSIQEAATNYTLRNAVSNYMFKVFPGLTPSVTNDADFSTYSALRVNFYGVTQIDGVQLAFYQQAVMCGGPTDPIDENVYSNESWMKGAAAAAIMNLQIGVPEIPADTSGENMVTNVLFSNLVVAGLRNGSIRVGKPLDANQKAYIDTVTGITNSWVQVQTDGYYLAVEIVPYTDPLTQLAGYQIEYLLVYSKNDVIRKVLGTHALI
jgi:hypothetical protein